MKNYKEFFNIKDNFTLPELIEARDKKKYSLSKLAIPNIDKKIYMSQIDKLFRIARFELYNQPSNLFYTPFNHFSRFDNDLYNLRNNYNNYSESKSYRE